MGKGVSLHSALEQMPLQLLSDFGKTDRRNFFFKLRQIFDLE